MGLLGRGLLGGSPVTEGAGENVFIVRNGKLYEPELTSALEGITRDTVKIGTEIVVDGYQTRDHTLTRANGRNITFTDGRKLFMGSSGTGAPRDGADATEPGK